MANQLVLRGGSCLTQNLITGTHIETFFIHMRVVNVKYQININYTFKILIAAQAAPKPLSIFTTDIPGLQLVSIDFNAVLPLSATPYPVEVGTAMTGV